MAESTGTCETFLKNCFKLLISGKWEYNRVCFFKGRHMVLLSDNR